MSIINTVKTQFKYIINSLSIKFKNVEHVRLTLKSILKNFKILICKFIKIKKKDLFFLHGSDEVSWSTSDDRKYCEYFLKLNDVELTNNVLLASYLFSIVFDYLIQIHYVLLKFLKKFLKIKIISLVTNDIRNNKWKVVKYRSIIDVWIAPSKRIYSFLKKNDCKVFLIPFYVSPNIFYQLKESKEKVCNMLDIDYSKLKNKIIIGSFQRDSLNSLNKPKWQKNPDLLIELMKNLQKDKFLLLLAGPRRHYILNECKKHNIPYIYYGNYKYIEQNKDDILINNQALEIINLLYNLSDLYIVSSVSEGGPKAILEASLTKSLIISTDVGFAQDFLHKDLIISNFNVKTIVNLIENLVKDQNKFNKYVEYNYKKVNNVLNMQNFNYLYRNLIKFSKS